VCDAPADVDDTLRPSQCASIDVMHASMQSLTHYELLGVKPCAEAMEVTRAYEALASAFSPTRFARVRRGPAGPRSIDAWQAKLDGIRARVLEAYATLSDPIRRARYDAEKKP
jgi:curved DNA-binding protein CbpA